MTRETFCGQTVGRVQGSSYAPEIMRPLVLISKRPTGTRMSDSPCHSGRMVELTAIGRLFKIDRFVEIEPND